LSSRRRPGPLSLKGIPAEALVIPTKVGTPSHYSEGKRNALDECRGQRRGPGLRRDDKVSEGKVGVGVGVGVGVVASIPQYLK